MNKDIIAYYHERAAEYDKVYQKPERQEDLQQLSSFLQEAFTGYHLIEISCGTGYWTEKIAATAASIFATDINERMLDIARQKDYPRENVQFGIADFYSFETNKLYEGLFGGFIWSHIPLQDLPAFLGKISRFVKPGGKVVFTDNNYVEGSNTAIAETDAEGNTYQRRQLENGDTYLVRKNFPAEAFLRQQLAAFSDVVTYHHFPYYWVLVYTAKS